MKVKIIWGKIQELERMFNDFSKTVNVIDVKVTGETNEEYPTYHIFYREKTSRDV